MPQEQLLCPFCKSQVEQERLSAQTSEVVCPKCGRYHIKNTLFGGDIGYNALERSLISGVIREANELGRELFEIAPGNLSEILAMAPRRLEERARRLLNAIHRRTRYFSHNFTLNLKNDVPLGYCQQQDEFHAVLEYLAECGFIRSPTVDSRHQTVGVTLTATGFAELESREKSNLESETAFVAMWFDDEVEEAFSQGIRPAVEDSGFDPVRIDLVEHNKDIVDEVLSEVRRARFMVSDFTGHRNGVYFESGFALGLGIPVIWTVRKDAADSAHFDTEHFNHIHWESTEELREKLTRRIVATIGTGPLKTT